MEKLDWFLEHIWIAVLATVGWALSRAADRHLQSMDKIVDRLDDMARILTEHTTQIALLTQRVVEVEDKRN